MKIKPEIKVLFLMNGNDGTLRQRMDGIDELPPGCAVRIVYTDRVAPANKTLIDEAVRNHATVTADCVSSGRKRAVQRKFIGYISGVHGSGASVRFILVTERFASAQMAALEAHGIITYLSAISAYASAEAQEQPEHTATPIKCGGPMQILIDYENVGAAGLAGTESLTKDDTVILFYSPSAAYIEHRYLDEILKRAGHFEAVRLKTVGKNALDFYIAVKVGQLIEQDPTQKIMIVTRDSGLHSIGQYCGAYTDLENPVIVRDSIEAGYIALDGGTERQKKLSEGRKKVSLEAAFEDYRASLQTEEKLRALLSGTPFISRIPEILELYHEAETPRELYHAAMHTFGRDDGRALYRLLKEFEA